MTSTPLGKFPGSVFITKDSGQRVEFPSGFRRDVQEGKPRYDLIPPEMLKRLAELYARGAEKYGDNNWREADPGSKVEMARFQASAFRHFMQWMNGEMDEDHASAIVFNVWAWEWVSNHSDKASLQRWLDSLPEEPRAQPWEQLELFSGTEVSGVHVH